MKIALIYNPDAGMGQLQIDDLKSLFSAAGYELLSVSTKNQQWRRLLSERFSRVVIAGGDGTVRKIVPLLAERNIPFSILPFGTANNIATSLHQMHPVEHLIAGLIVPAEFLRWSQSNSLPSVICEICAICGLPLIFGFWRPNGGFPSPS